MVRAIMIIEMMGRPKEHISSQIREHIGLMDKVKGLEVIKKDFSEPKKIDDKNNLYTCFCEVEIECINFIQLYELVLDFMPSSIEVLDPSKLNFTIDEATSVLNNLSGRLHRYDDVVKIMKNREHKLMEDLKVSLSVLKAYNLIDDSGKLKKEVVEKVNEFTKKSNKEESNNIKINQEEKEKTSPESSD
jgi:hypothetical protein